MKLASIIFTIWLAALGCKQDAVTEKPQPGDTTGLSFLALGDSYTIGQSVTIEERWPVILAKDLKAQGIDTRSPEIKATTGWTTRDLLDATENIPANADYDMVSLMIGVNNQFRGRSLSEYEQEFALLLAKSIAFAGGDANKVFVLSIPDWGVTPYGEGDREKIALEIDQFNAAARAICEKANVLFIDITPISRKALNDQTMLANDRLHFSGKMHQLWVNEVISKIKSRI